MVPLRAAESPTFIPFQGRITDQAGNTYTNGQYSILFQLYSQAVGGTAIWQERHDKVGVVNGLVNVFLGSISPLSSVDFSSTKHLGITIDADGIPTTPEPEMVPRQMIIPAFWAKNSEKLAGQDWTPIFGSNSPLGTIPATKLKSQSITSNQIAGKTITEGQIANSSITSQLIVNGAIQSDDLAPNSVGTAHLLDGSVTQSKLDPLIVWSNLTSDGVIMSKRGFLDCGEGSEGNAILSGDLDGEHYFNDLTITNTLSVGPLHWLVLRVRGTLTLTGNINGTGKGGAGGLGGAQVALYPCTK